MAKVNKVFDETYRYYMERLATLDLAERANRLALEVVDNVIHVPLLGESYRASAAGIVDAEGQRAGFSQCIVIFKSLLMAPREPQAEGEWIAYHAFRDAQPLLDYFAREVTGPVERRFSGKLPELERAGEALRGMVVGDGASFDLSIQFSLMPRVPLFLRFNDRDEDFPAQCTILFRQSLAAYLDMESVGVLGSLFARKLIG